MSLESYLYEEKIDKLVGLLDEVLDAWKVQVDFDIDNYTLYVKANDYLKGLRDE